MKRLDQAYPAGRRGWQKLRHTDVRDAAVIGYTGTPAARSPWCSSCRSGTRPRWCRAR